MTASIPDVPDYLSVIGAPFARSTDAPPLVPILTLDVLWLDVESGEVCGR